MRCAWRVLGPVAASILALAACGGGDGGTCSDGTVGCPCLAGGACTTGECVSGTCADCARGEKGCVCLDNKTCGAGLRCSAGGLCVDCPGGGETCPCKADGTCDADLECKDKVCVKVPCPEGTKDCPCKAEDACDTGMYCDTSKLCRQCGSDVEGCPCEAGACKAGLVCDTPSDKCRKAKKCADVACVPHQVCEEKTGLDAACAAACEKGWAWDPGSGACKEAPAANCKAGQPASILDECEGKHRACVEDAAGAHCGACKDFFLEEAGTCRGVETCLDAGCEAAHRECAVETATTDAACGACLQGYLVEGDTCVEPPAFCGEGPGGILLKCEAEARECVQPREGPASCGPCLPGHAENSTGACQETHTCDELQCYDKNRVCTGEVPFQACGPCLEGYVVSATDPAVCAFPKTCAQLACPAEQFCVSGGVGQDAKCVTAPCPAGLAWRDAPPDKQGCVATCDVSCNATDPGETGRVWPYTLTGSSTCICETLPGWYWDEGQRSGQPCDSDGDGWARTAARPYIESADPALVDNARCSLHVIDRFTLENEYGQRLDVYLCTGDPAFRSQAQGYCETFAPLPLYETVRNDDQAELDLDVNVPAYTLQGAGRRPLASELNGLTRLCVAGADFNENGVSDLSEWHGMPKGAMTADQHVMSAFSYYVELDRGYFEAQDGKPFGRYVISERSRCDIDHFPVRYSVADGTWWRQCTRSRDAAFDATDGVAGPDLGMEFAEWSCETAKGGCPVPPPPSDLDATVLPGVAPDHGLCEVALPPQDEECLGDGDPWLCVGGAAWRGMSHHSQFKCVVLNTEASTTEPRIPPLDVYTGKYRFDQCRVACPAADPTCATDCSGGVCAESSIEPSGGANPADPAITCVVVETPPAGSVGFAAVAYQGGASYSRGCIDEWTPDTVKGSLNGTEDPVVSAWRRLCPGWLAGPDAAIGDGNTLDFGRLQCGCGNHYGGLACETGCPDPYVHLSPGYEATPRAGWWLCGNTSVTAHESTVTDLGYVSAGDDGEGATWVLRGGVPSTPLDGTSLCQEQGCASGFVLTSR